MTVGELKAAIEGKPDGAIVVLAKGSESALCDPALGAEAVRFVPRLGMIVHVCEDGETWGDDDEAVDAIMLTPTD